MQEVSNGSPSCMFPLSWLILVIFWERSRINLNLEYLYFVYFMKQWKGKKFIYGVAQEKVLNAFDNLSEFRF